MYRRIKDKVKRVQLNKKSILDMIKSIPCSYSFGFKATDRKNKLRVYQTLGENKSQADNIKKPNVRIYSKHRIKSYRS